ncbi:hypothetical protein UAY_00468 [Enterococcus moraviensis ATCC BAA-383]|uniref:Cytoplasmic protein n=1 Tax=Enterococcus moraviensis ATCC BAA-383 TaxID=1158609 RepID=R2U187_9ENTE|nr:DUF4312 family protein [Enterococcus moraviensis]EOI06417.1 hypothetical protein UAY_00468 [Enterococcus moraviensis ATCC BAA-383]EOT63777.1 hypothetical protein I586_03210 [Enterococcus moraviensis ATCC BAA-383]OJG67093.1 hypothetical protein RV09_GL003002 [Enterococcus moraviensis]
MEKVTVKKRQVIQVEGTGKEKNLAFANALNQIHNRVLKEKDDVIVRIEPLDIQIIRAEQETFTERFLFFFLPRTRADYRVLLDVEVEITLIEMEMIPFVEKRVSDPNGLPIPFSKKKRVHKEAN